MSNYFKSNVRGTGVGILRTRLKVFLAFLRLRREYFYLRQLPGYRHSLWRENEARLVVRLRRGEAAR